MKKKVAVACVAICSIFIACNKEGNIADTSLWKNSSENASTGLGRAYTANGFLYYTDGKHIYEYDVKTKESLVIDSDGVASGAGISASEEAVYFQTGFSTPTIKKISFDTQIEEKAYYVETENNHFMFPYYDGDDIYGLSMQMGDLVHFDREKQSAEVLETEILIYVKEEENLFYIKYYPQEERSELYRWSDGDKKPKLLNVEISPIQLSIEGDTLILSQMGDWLLYEYNIATGDMEVQANVFSFQYQVRGRNLYYIPRESGNNFADIIQRNLDTGDEKVVCNNVQQGFCVLDENTLVCWDYYDRPMLVDTSAVEPIVTKLPVVQ